MRHTKQLLIILAAILIIIISCKSVPVTIDEDLPPADFFQLAQEAVSVRNDYNTALVYYQTFIKRYPDEIQKIAEAEYEIAFIYYSKNDYETAKKLFQKLLDKYKEPGAELLPGWPHVLSIKLLKKIEEEKKKEEPAEKSSTSD